MRRFPYACLLNFCVFLGTPFLRASVPPVLQISDSNGDVVTIDSTGAVVFSGSCSPATCQTTLVHTQPGAIEWGGTVGPFSLTLTVAVTKAPASPAPTMDLAIQQLTSATGGTIKFQWTDTNFTTPSITGTTLETNGTMFGNDTASFVAYTDNSNAPFGTGIPVGPPLTVTGNGLTSINVSESGSGPTAVPFSITEVATITLGPGGSFAADELFNAVPAALNLPCPINTGQVGVPYTSTLAATGGVPPFTYSISSGSLPPGLTLNPSTGLISGTPTVAGTFTFTVQVTDATGAVTTTNCSIVISAPLSNNCVTSAATLVFPSGPVPENAFLIRYAANLDHGDSTVEVTNYGLNGAPLQGPGFGAAVGNICVNIYAFAPDEQLVSCCSCLVTPNAVVRLSVLNDLLSNPLTPVRPTSAVIKLVSSAPGTTSLTGGMSAWGTTLHPLNTTGTAFGLTETPFTPAKLSSGELASITNRCANNLANGSGSGVCSACRLLVPAGAANQ
ncbi:MAG TPA: Ig domain-containing protein [Bryobacteraceae bacterium]|jgi:hypothetical protein|nr:Ig domain-containing protein [Bryobacteraceae bacterium]